MEHELRNEVEESRNLVGRNLGRMIVAGVDCLDDVVLRAVSCVEVV